MSNTVKIKLDGEDLRLFLLQHFAGASFRSLRALVDLTQGQEGGGGKSHATRNRAEGRKQRTVDGAVGAGGNAAGVGAGMTRRGRGEGGT